LGKKNGFILIKKKGEKKKGLPMLGFTHAPCCETHDEGGIGRGKGNTTQSAPPTIAKGKKKKFGRGKWSSMFGPSRKETHYTTFATANGETWVGRKTQVVAKAKGGDDDP